jgi:hypothetical protein
LELDCRGKLEYRMENEDEGKKKSRKEKKGLSRNELTL